MDVEGEVAQDKDRPNLKKQITTQAVATNRSSQSEKEEQEPKDSEKSKIDNESIQENQTDAKQDANEGEKLGELDAPENLVSKRSTKSAQETSAQNDQEKFDVKPRESLQI